MSSYNLFWWFIHSLNRSLFTYFMIILYIAMSLYDRVGDSVRSLLWEEQGPNSSLLWEEEGPNSSLLWEEQGPNSSLLWEEQGPNSSLLWEEEGPNSSLLWEEQGPNSSLLWEEQGPNRAVALLPLLHAIRMMMPQRGWVSVTIVARAIVSVCQMPFMVESFPFKMCHPLLPLPSPSSQQGL